MTLARGSQRPDPWAQRLGYALTWIALIVPALLVDPAARDQFRLPKLMASELLGLLSLLLLAFQFRDAKGVRPWRHPVFLASLPLALVAGVSLFTTSHPAHAREAVADLWIGVACLVGWSLGLPARRLRALLDALAWPATVLAGISILQFHGLLEPWVLFESVSRRYRNISLAGNVGDLGIYLLLPILAMLSASMEATGVRRARLFAQLGLCLYALVLTQTLTAMVAGVAGILVLTVARRPRLRTILASLLAAAVGLTMVATTPGVERRLERKVAQVEAGQLNRVLSGRLDGWRAGVWMWRLRPWRGVGAGGYLPEYVPAKLGLIAAGASFSSTDSDPTFGNAHNELVEVAAELGWPGLLALLWGIALLGRAAWRRPTPPAAGKDERDRDRSLALAGLVSLTLVSVAWFPLRLGLTAYPWLVFAAWIFRRETEGQSR